MRLLEQEVNCWLDVQILQKGKLPKEYPLFLKESGASEDEKCVMQSLPIAIVQSDKGGFIRAIRSQPNKKDYRLILRPDRSLPGRGTGGIFGADDSYLRGILNDATWHVTASQGETALRVLQERRAMGVNGSDAGELAQGTTVCGVAGEDLSLNPFPVGKGLGMYN